LIVRSTFIFFVFLLTGCTQKEELKVQRSFYYWKSAFSLSQKEKQLLKDLSVHHLYVKFFDVSWDPVQNAARPVAKILFSETPADDILITPVVFITNETVQQINQELIDSLAGNISKLLLSSSDNLPLSNEVQIDCDWTTNTKEKYFQLLQSLRKQFFFKNKTLSATIRLHQLKFVSENGVPPVDKALVMCYNMGNLRHPQTKNSIIETGEIKKYISNLNHYPLPVDIALPVFDWWVKFSGNRYEGLVHSFYLPDSLKLKERLYFKSDTLLNGIEFKQGEWLRYEGSSINVLKECIYSLNKKLKSGELNVILYHLDENNLKKYTVYELENIYNSFH